MNVFLLRPSIVHCTKSWHCHWSHRTYFM